MTSKNSNRRIVIVGGGFTGLSAAYDLSSRGFQVTVLEAEPELGGLGGVFEVSPGVWLEKFYHHWFTSDRDIIGLVEEIGLGSKLKSMQSNTGLFFVNSIFRLSSPWDLLRFPGIPFIDRVRTGMMALWARRISDWKALETLSAEEWLIRIGGRRAYESIWRPLLQGKFGPEASHVSAVWFWNKLKLRGGSRDKSGAECLMYLDGSFGSLVNALRDAIISRGGKVHINSPVKEIISHSGAVTGVKTDSTTFEADQVLVTAPLPSFLEMTPGLPTEYKEKYSKLRFLGNVCLILRLTQRLSETYWINVADPSFPFVGVIEHSNFEELKNLGGEHIAYLSKYLPTTDHLYRAADDEVLEFCLPHIQRIFPAFSRSWLKGFKVWRAAYSQPVITKHYSQLIPASKTPISGLWLATMAQIYPEDRGTNYAVRQGRQVAREIAGA